MQIKDDSTRNCVGLLLFLIFFKYYITVYSFKWGGRYFYPKSFTFHFNCWNYLISFKFEIRCSHALCLLGNQDFSPLISREPLMISVPIISTDWISVSITIVLDNSFEKNSLPILSISDSELVGMVYCKTSVCRPLSNSPSGTLKDTMFPSPESTSMLSKI